MGFSQDHCKKALIKSKNESLAAAVDVVMELIVAEPKKPEVIIKKNFKYLGFTCPACTFINVENNAHCAVCGAECPKEAVIEIVDELEVQKKKEDSDRKKQEEEAIQTKLLEEELKRKRAEGLKVLIE
jgi:hypothetical protein